MSSDADPVVVVGGGLVGCFAAYYLSQFGRHVTLLERDRLGSGASHGNCGYICPSHALPLSGPGVIRKTLPALFAREGALSIPARWDPDLWRWLLRFRGECSQEKMMRAARGRAALLMLSRHLYDGLFREKVLEAEHQALGLLTVYRTAAEFDAFETTAELLDRDFGIETRSIAGDDLAAFEPSLRPGLGGGWLFPNDSHVRPDRVVESLRAELQSAGVAIREGEPLKSICIERDRCRGVETDGGVIDAAAVVLATGAEASRWSRTLGCPVPIQPGKGYSITLERLPSQPRVPMIFEETHVAVTPFASGFRIGSTMEFSGFDTALSPKRLALLRSSARAHLVTPIPETGGEAWCGWRPMSADGLPMIGAVPAAANLFLAAGNGMIGLASAPATGKLVAELVSGREPEIDPTAYRSDRFR